MLGVKLLVFWVKKSEFVIYFRHIHWKYQIRFQQKCYQQLIDSCLGPFWPVFGGNFTNSKNLQEMCAISDIIDIIDVIDIINIIDIIVIVQYIQYSDILL